jgi:hypothetical protein
MFAFYTIVKRLYGTDIRYFNDHINTHYLHPKDKEFDIQVLNIIVLNNQFNVRMLSDINGGKDLNTKDKSYITLNEVKKNKKWITFAYI